MADAILQRSPALLELQIEQKGRLRIPGLSQERQASRDILDIACGCEVAALVEVGSPFTRLDSNDAPPLPLTQP
ncbi:hypothetical protein DX914_03465 [Lysobacter silvisoli]|uniref:Uncharacterized protein n=1 Tax=Lysobacter silvisoli TaxID=2293254 RepID=A0A371K2Y9_9GAMM|nr:hypothetical protein DX914_03465 [Lysobacter silvisoli]